MKDVDLTPNERALLRLITMLFSQIVLLGADAATLSARLNEIAEGTESDQGREIIRAMAYGLDPDPRAHLQLVKESEKDPGR